MLLTFKDYQSYNIDFNALGQINESHQYFDAVCSVMDKLTFYVKRGAALEASNLNESAKRAYSRDIKFNRDERIAASCIFNEMINKYKENIQDELTVCEAIINQGSLLEESVEYDIDTFIESIVLEEGLKDLIKGVLQKGKEGISNAGKAIIDNAKDITAKGIEVVKVKKDELVAWAKQAKKDFEERFTALRDLVLEIVKKGIDTVEEFINKILKVFTAIGDNLVDAVKKLGGLKMDDGEKPVTLDLEDAEGLYKTANGEEEKSFINSIILRVEAILKKDPENAQKLMLSESYVAESIVDNKFIAWMAGYKSDGSKVNIWKTILVGICATLIVTFLPKILGFFSVSAAITIFVASLVSLIWNGIGLLKLIYKRNKERRPGEKFFDKKTTIFFVLSSVSIFFSAKAFLKSVGPFMAKICEIFGFSPESSSAFGRFMFDLTKKINPKDAFSPDGFKEISEEVKNFGADVRGKDIVASGDAAVKTMSEMPGASEANISAFRKFLDAVKDAKGSSGVYEAWKEFINDPNLPFTAVFDTSKWGGSGPITKAIKELKNAGLIPDSAIIGTAGSVATQTASKGAYGFVSYITGVSPEQANMIFQRAGEIAGKSVDTLQLHTYGTGAIANVLTTTEKVTGAFNFITPKLPFLPMLMPFFNKKKWGDYKIRFASATRGSAAYVVDKVEMHKADEIEGHSDAFNVLQTLHNDAWNEYKSLFLKEGEGEVKEVSEGIFRKSKRDKEEEKKIEEPKYIVFYVKPEESTGKDTDTPNEKEEEGKEEEKKEKKDSKKNESKSAVGIVIDTLTLMCADVCDFGENTSAEIRRRPKPYFMKGLLSRLSFRPTKDGDNETKDYIRTTLGQTMNTLITQCVLFGMGKKYIDSTIEDNKAKYIIRNTVVGDDKKKIYSDKPLFELGNFSPKELVDCLSDESQSHKVSYDFLDGSFASKVSIKTDEKTGEIKSKSAARDASTIENIKYYRVSKDTYDQAMEDWKKDVAKWEKDGKKDKKPSKPTFVKGYDNEHYKRASKKWLNDPEHPEHRRKKLYDFVDIRIVPLLKKGDLYKKLVANDKFKNVLYKEEEEGNVKLNHDVIEVLKPFLYRPEKTFARDDEYQLKQLLKDQGVEGEHIGWFKNLFKDEEQIHDTFKNLVEAIWDYLEDNRRDIWKRKDFKQNHSKKNEDVEYTLFDSLIEEFFNDEYDERTEYKYDVKIIREETKHIPSFKKYILEQYNEVSELHCYD